MKDFRHWCQDKWYEHREELEAYRQPVNYNTQDYFNKYRWWLKREYKYQYNLLQKSRT